MPGIWPLELTNALRTGERRQRLRAADTARFSEIIRWLPITVEQVRLDRSLGDVLDVARNYDLTSYDASYLELAMREGIPLATQDARLTAAATRAGVPILD